MKSLTYCFAFNQNSVGLVFGCQFLRFFTGLRSTPIFLWSFQQFQASRNHSFSLEGDTALFSYHFLWDLSIREQNFLCHLHFSFPDIKRHSTRPSTVNELITYLGVPVCWSGFQYSPKYPFCRLYDHCCFCNHGSVHFSILRVRANTLYDCYSGIFDSFIFIENSRLFFPVRGLLFIW